MSQEPEPPVHGIVEGDKLRICLSVIGKWIAGIFASIVTALLLGAATFAWQSNFALGQIKANLENVNDRLDRIETQLDGERR